MRFICLANFTVFVLMIRLPISVPRTEAGDKKEAKKTGTVIGVLVDRTYGKGVLVKADGEETPRRYWRFGDRPKLNKEIDAVPLGSRVRLTWETPDANEGPHVAKIEILKSASPGADSK